MYRRPTTVGQQPTTGMNKLNFMEKLVKILEESDPAVVRWNETGTSFLVADLKR
jgi:hypothetical protein